DVAHVGFEIPLRLGEAFFVEQVIVPLANRVEVLRIDSTVDQGQALFDTVAGGQVGHAEARDADRLVGMVGSNVPSDGAAPIVADPYRTLATERGQELEHVLDDQLLRKVLMARVGAGAAVAAHVGCDAAETERSEYRQLMAPRERELGPAVAED